MPQTTEIDPVRVPQSRATPWIERLLWLFMLSFAFDYRGSVDQEAAGSTGLDQLFFLALCASSVLGMIAMGWRNLTVRPGAWLLMSWGLLVSYLVMNAFVQGVDPGRSLRTALPFGLCLAGMAAAHIAACSGVGASRIVAPVFIAACINIVWRIVHGFLFKDVSLESVRVEVLSPATNWMAAWIGCALILRRSFHPSLLLACALLAAGVLITVTRALIFPVFVSFLVAGICFLLGSFWQIFKWKMLQRKMIPIAAAGFLVLATLGTVGAFYPALIQRWNERLFHHADDRNITMDVSWMTRRAEAEDILKILARDPVRFVHGMGIGASYTWSSAYIPELLLVYPEDADLGDDVWFAGHSTWTYALFAGGAIGIVGHLLLFGGVSLLSLRSVIANSRLPGPDIWLAFLPLVAVFCFLSESATSNPFYERLAGMIFGIMAGLPQAFFIRATFLNQRHDALNSHT